MNHSEEIIVEIENLTKIYNQENRIFTKGREIFKAVDGVNLKLKKGRTLGLVGESGSGKSTIARCLVGLAKIDGGRILYRDRDISQYDRDTLKSFRRQVQMIFQDPYSSFDPKKIFSFSLQEPLNLYSGDDQSIENRITEILYRVGLDPALKQRYPRQLSGGQCQRMNIARALLLKPELIICDEPVSALDISIQAQILNLLKELQKEYGLTFLFISHDLSVIKYMSDDVAVIYKGRIVEQGSCAEVLKLPRHPYTRLLLNSLPPNSPYERSAKKKTESTIEELLEGCSFYKNCSARTEICRQSHPKGKQISGEHYVECFH